MNIIVLLSSFFIVTNIAAEYEDKHVHYSLEEKQKYGVAENDEPWTYVNFDDCMRPKDFAESLARVDQLWGMDCITVYRFFRAMYERSNPSMVKPAENPKIPKIIHQIWIGGPVPEIFKPLNRTWVQRYLGRGWRYKLWTDEDVKDFPMQNREFYDATDNPGVKSDLLKWEIIHRYGGVYVDMDHECLRPLDILHYVYDFYTCLQPLDSGLLQLGAALFAATPGHPILKHCIDTVKDDWHHKGAPTKTGPLHFTKSFLHTAAQAGGVVAALPSFYMYPLTVKDVDINYAGWKRGGAYAVHWWARSWMPEDYRAPYFKNLNNNEEVKSWND